MFPIWHVVSVKGFAEVGKSKIKLSKGTYIFRHSEAGRGGKGHTGAMGGGDGTGSNQK